MGEPAERGIEPAEDEERSFLRRLAAAAAQSAGLEVSALSALKNVDAAMVMANWR